MATIIDLSAERRKRCGTTFAFDLASPWTYLASASVADDFPDALWVPALGDEPRDRAAAERAAHELGVRFAWPRQGVPDGIAAGRAATLAAEHGRAK
ncbi:MAG TPA: hypothetical protein VGW10_19655, partial [Solirubrobacteraceae bacterium]|nr:hypothetical protein [Solirubrobacteraceae bacterium]